MQISDKVLNSEFYAKLKTTAEFYAICDYVENRFDNVKLIENNKSDKEQYLTFCSMVPNAERSIGYVEYNKEGKLAFTDGTNDIFVPKIDAKYPLKYEVY